MKREKFLMNFTGKTVLITGAGAGIGRQTAIRFASLGAKVIAIDRDAKALEAIAPGVVELALDVSDNHAVAQLSELGPIDVLFNCAGIVASGTILETSRADWDKSLAINVTAVYEITRAVLPAMLEKGSGVIVNMASVVSSVKGFPNRFAYGASKAAVIGLTKSIAADFVGRGIRCNAVCPGTVDTPSLQDRMHATGDYDAARAAFIARQPMGRLARADEIADLVVYLSSDAAAFMTGQAICMDGGISI
jgi:2-keto-3-deoxy-L-fuconate dehydrogenase